MTPRTRISTSNSRWSWMNEIPRQTTRGRSGRMFTFTISATAHGSVIAMAGVLPKAISMAGARTSGAAGMATMGAMGVGSGLRTTRTATWTWTMTQAAGTTMAIGTMAAMAIGTMATMAIGTMAIGAMTIGAGTMTTGATDSTELLVPWASGPTELLPTFFRSLYSCLLEQLYRTVDARGKRKQSILMPFDGHSKFTRWHQSHKMWKNCVLGGLWPKFQEEEGSLLTLSSFFPLWLKKFPQDNCRSWKKHFGLWPFPGCKYGALVREWVPAPMWCITSAFRFHVEDGYGMARTTSLFWCNMFSEILISCFCPSQSFVPREWDYTEKITLGFRL